MTFDQNRSVVKGAEKLAVLGGDLRQMVTAKALAADGYEVAVYAMDTYTGDWGEVTRAADLLSAVRGASLVVLPLPVSQDDERLHCPLTRKTVLLPEVFGAMSPGQHAAGGKISAGVRRMAEERGVILSDYLCREELSVANAVPTAEGAIAVAMAEVPYTIHGARCLVLGFGRVGKTLSRALRALGALVTVAARRPSDLAWIAAEQCRPLPFDELLHGTDALAFDLVFNTVPEPVLGSALLLRLPKDTLLLDLASAPGGIDRDYAREHGHRVVWALSLPGRTAPVTAGRIVKDSIVQMLAELHAEQTAPDGTEQPAPSADAAVRRIPGTSGEGADAGKAGEEEGL